MIKKILLILILLIGVIYGRGVIYTDHRFLPNTYIDGLRLDGNGFEKGETVRANAPLLKVLQKNKDTGAVISETINMASDADYRATYKVKDLLDAQDELMWFKSLFGKTELNPLPLEGYYNKDKLLNKIADLYCFQEANVSEPVNAHVELIDGKLQIVPEQDNLQMNMDAAVEKITDAIARIMKGEKVENVDLSEDYLKAEIRSDDPGLIARLAEMKKVTDKKVTVKISSGSSETIEGEKLARLLTVEDEQFAVNEDKLAETVKKIYEDNYVSSYEFIDQESLLRSLGEALLANEDKTVEVKWIDSYSSSSNRNNRIEVKLSEQTLYYYEDDKLVFTSPIVSAAPGVTPVGEFEVTKIDGSSILSGPTWEERVEYWIGFDPTGVHKGFHDASWRSEFGGDIYLTDPSHGCINMPTNMVARLWGLVHLGTPVTIYE